MYYLGTGGLWSERIRKISKTYTNDNEYNVHEHIVTYCNIIIR